MSRVDDLFHVLKVIRRIVDDADDDPPASGTETEPRAPVAWTPGSNDVAAYSDLLINASSSAAGQQRLATELLARYTDIAANQRGVAEELLEAGDLQHLYLFCLEQINDREPLVHSCLEGLSALYKLEDIKRALAAVDVPPRTKNAGKGARGADTKGGT